MLKKIKKPYPGEFVRSGLQRGYYSEKCSDEDISFLGIGGRELIFDRYNCDRTAHPLIQLCQNLFS